MAQLNPLFVQTVLEDQDCFASEAGYRTLLELIPDYKVVEALKKIWSPTDGKSSSQRWKEMKVEITKYDKATINRVNLARWLVELDCAFSHFPGKTPRRDGGHRPSVHLPALGCGGVKTPEPFAQSTVLYPSQDRQGLRANRSFEGGRF